MTELFIITLGLWCTGWLLRCRMTACLPRRAQAGGVELGVTPAACAERLSIIIPARNEETTLPNLLRSIRSQSVKPREIIVVDDGSMDRTAEVAQQLGAKVIRSQPLPEDWRGKTWACHQGAQAATGELLMFLDADTWFEPEGLVHLFATYVVQPAMGGTAPQTNRTPKCEKQTQQTEPGSFLVGAFSVGPYHAVQKLHEQSSLFFNLTMVVGTVPNGLFGQMLLVDRQSYLQVGGHETVRGKILENYFLAQRFRAAGVPVRSVTGRGVLSFRMYPNGLRELIEGWTKGFAAGAGQTPRGVLVLVVGWMTGLTLAPLGWAISGDWLRWGTLYLVCAAQVGWLSRCIGSFRWYTALLYPVPLVFFFGVFARAALRSGKHVTWKGRNIRAD